MTPSPYKLFPDGYYPALQKDIHINVKQKRINFIYNQFQTSCQEKNGAATDQKGPHAVHEGLFQKLSTYKDWGFSVLF
ncbi:MAG: hypothetical protein BA872_06390 [Desulfobacterales bacterium C00003060]|nr:MAG: hypothetical protein BA872_06390 [Desulfobacterales bacterium C00003060]